MAMAHKLELADIKDLINLTFCCQQVTVITNFSDLERIGRTHRLNLSGGAMPGSANSSDVAPSIPEHIPFAAR